MRKKICGLLAALLTCVTLMWLVGCQSNHTSTPGDTDAVSATVPTEETVSEPPAEQPTTPSTDEAKTDAPVITEAPTEAVTEPPIPVVQNTVTFDVPEDVGVDAFVARMIRCKAELVEDPQEGRVLKISGSGSVAGSDSASTVYIRPEALAMAQGGAEGSMAIDAEHPYLLVKVKVHQLGGNAVHVTGYANPRGPANAEKLYARLSRAQDAASEWQYICFDFSRYTTKVSYLLMDFELLLGGEDASVLMSEMRVLNAEEATPYMNLTYPVPNTSDPAYEWTVMQFNVQTQNGNSAPFAVRADLYRDLVDQLMPDSVGMQEVTTQWIEWLDRMVFNKSYTRVGEARSEGGEANPIYYRSDIYDLVDSGTFWLSETPNEVGSKLEDSAYPRICTWVILRDRVTGYEYVHANTHLDHISGTKGNAVRLEQIRILLSFLQTLGDRPMVLTGDFNSTQHNASGEERKLYKYITGTQAFTSTSEETITGRFSDARLHALQTVPADQIATMTKYYDTTSEKYDPTHEPIDFVFYTADVLEALSYQTGALQKGNMETSDHLALWVRIRKH